VNEGQVVPCALCGATDTVRLYTKWKWGIERCRRCGLVYANPRAPESKILGRYSSEYFWNEYLPAAGAAGGHIDYVFIDDRHKMMLDLIRQHAPEGTRFLEVGCGAGLLLKAAQRAGWTTAGIELSPDAASFARERLGLDVRQERAEEMSFPPGSFDVAVMSEVIEHLFQPRTVVRALRAALKPGGILLITTPNFEAISRHVHGVNWEVLSPLEHTYYFTARTLSRLLGENGFEVIETNPVLPILLDYVSNPQGTHAPDSWRARLWKRVLAKNEGLRYHFGFDLGQWLQAHGYADTLTVFAAAR